MASTIWKGHLTFGLVSIPIKLVRAARAEKIHMHNLQRGTGKRVRQMFVPEEGATEELPESSNAEAEELSAVTTAGQSRKAAAPGPILAAPKRAAAATEALAVQDGASEPPHNRAVAPVSAKDLVRGFEYEKDRYVEFDKEELEEMAPRTSSEMQILEFVRFSDVDAVYLESSYYAIADKGGDKPYALLFQALKKSGYAAIAEFVMHRRDQTIILRPGRHGLVGHTLFYEDEVRRNDEYRVDPGQVNAKEMELAMKLVEALAAPFEPEKFKDKYRERLQEAIAEKVQTGAVHQSPPAERKAPVVDIMAALKESLLQTKKPAAREAVSASGKGIAPKSVRERKGGGERKRHAGGS